MLASAVEENVTAEIKTDKQPPHPWLRAINLIMWCSEADVWEITFLAVILQNVSKKQLKKRKAFFFKDNPHLQRKTTFWLREW